MRIGIDGGCWGNRRGYGRFLHEILNALADTGSDHEYTVLLDRASYEACPLPEPFQPLVVETRQSVAEAATAGSSRSIGDLARMNRAVARLKPDLLFFPSVYSFFPVFGRFPVIVCIHDTIPERDPKLHFDSWKQSLAWRVKVSLAIARAARVVTVSEYSKRCLSEFLGVSGDKVRIVSEAASPDFQPRPPAGDRNPYLLYVGGFSPHKNLFRLVRAFAALRPQSGNLQLILAGDYSRDTFKGSYPELRQLVEQLALGDAVSFPGYVTDEELRGLYSGAAAVVLPSMDEGFGLPALEAMACGAPVVVSRGNAMEEVVGGAGLLIDPEDEAGMTATLTRVLVEPGLAGELRAKAVRRAADFSWDRSARQLLAVFEEQSELKLRAR